MTAFGPALKRVRAEIARSLERNSPGLGNARLLVAVSGGPDSTALLLAIASLSPVRRPIVTVAHFSHGLRPQENEARESEQVRLLANSFGLPFLHGTGIGSGSEENARKIRYEFLAEALACSGSSAITVGHTRDDQAETVLMKITRGAGLQGASGMAELSSQVISGRNCQIFRPILRVTRTDTEAVCQEFELPPVIDPSNASLRYARNRIRKIVIPALNRINPRAAESIARFAATAGDDEALLQDMAARAIDGAEFREKERIMWDTGRLRAMPNPLIVRVLLAGLEHLTGDGSSISGKALDRAIRLLATQSQGSIPLGHGMRFVTDRGGTIIKRNASSKI